MCARTVSTSGSSGTRPRVVRLADPVDRCFTRTMAVLAGIVGALVGFFVGVLFTEVSFANGASWDVVPFVLAVFGWLAARELLRRHRSRKPERSAPSAHA